MRENYSRLYVHLVWGTWDRLPLITPQIQVAVYQGIQEQARRTGCELIAVGGIEDHVYTLLRIPTTVTIADVVKSLKGGSTHMVNHALKPGTFFKWQGSYGAFTVSRSHLPMVRSYVLNQERHHALNRLSSGLERVSTDG